MKRPKFTDAHKFAHPYRASCNTNILKTVQRRHRELKAEAEAQALKDQETMKEQGRKVSALKTAKA